MRDYRNLERGVMGSLVIAIGALLAACSGDPAAPEAEDVFVRVNVSGGLAGLSHIYEVDGGALVARGTPVCRESCAVGDAEAVVRLTAAQVLSIAALFREAQVFLLDGKDFGNECCDQPYYNITYREGERAATVSGSDGALPAGLVAALAAVDRLFQEATPIIVDFDSRPEDWQHDPLTLRRYSLEGHVLELDVEYGGGCKEHDLDLVAWGGFLESFPVQVNVLLSHDGHDDACEALIMRTLRFYLVPLRDEFVPPHRDGGPGATTLILRLNVPDGEGLRLIEYSF